MREFASVSTISKNKICHAKVFPSLLTLLGFHGTFWLYSSVRNIDISTKNCERLKTKSYFFICMVGGFDNGLLWLGNYPRQSWIELGMCSKFFSEILCFFVFVILTILQYRLVVVCYIFEINLKYHLVYLYNLTPGANRL